VDLIENGIYLCGGASQSVLIKEKIAELTNIEVNVVDESQQAVISGLSKMLDFAHYFA
jgi:actin-like ATPase involved in cell morphogenesis